MKYVKFYFSTMLCGTEGSEVQAYPDDVKSTTIENDGIELAENNAESYSYLVDEESTDDYDESVEYSWEYITEEEYLENQ